MPDSSGFKHIEVDTFDEDEVVIQAGDVPTVNQASQESVEGSVRESDSGIQKGSLEAEALERMGLDEQEISQDDLDELRRHVRASAMRQESTLMATTQDDLHAKMPFARMQRITVAVVVLIAVAVAVYWFASH